MGQAVPQTPAMSVKASLPITGRLYPAHYSLIYYSKPKTFRKIRTPIESHKLNSRIA